MRDETNAVTNGSSKLHILRANDNDTILLIPLDDIHDDALRRKVHAISGGIKQNHALSAQHAEGECEHLAILKSEFHRGDVTHSVQVISYQSLSDFLIDVFNHAHEHAEHLNMLLSCHCVYKYRLLGTEGQEVVPHEAKGFEQIIAVGVRRA